MLETFITCDVQKNRIKNEREKRANLYICKKLNRDSKTSSLLTDFSVSLILIN